jgi:hypothetical protein
MKAMRPLAATWTAGALTALLIGAAVAPAVPAWAAEEEKSIDQTLMDAIMLGIGLERERPQIDYRERGPLVIPPTKALPAPERSDAVMANPAWPKDPDVTRQREAAKRERERDVSAEREREQNPLPPDQIGPRGSTTRSARRDDGYQNSASGFSEVLKPDKLGYTGGLIKKMFSKDDEEAVRFTGEPKRTDLTAPPPGYQTPSPDQPYGPGKGPAPKATNDYLERGELKN